MEVAAAFLQLPSCRIAGCKPQRGWCSHNSQAKQWQTFTREFGHVGITFRVVECRAALWDLALIVFQ